MRTGSRRHRISNVFQVPGRRAGSLRIGRYTNFPDTTMRTGCPCCIRCCTWVLLSDPRAVLRHAVANLRKKSCVTTNQRNEFESNDSHLIQIKTLLIFIQIKRHLASMSDIARIKSDTLQLKVLPLKRPKSFCIAAQHPTPSQRDGVGCPPTQASNRMHRLQP